MPESKNIVIYRDKNKKIEVNIEKETLWLDTRKIAYIFSVDRTVVVKHIKNIYKTRELVKKSTCAKIAQVAADGKTRRMSIYNLDVIIAVGYRVNSKRATLFRIWATEILRNYLINGYLINDKRITIQRLEELEKNISLIKSNIKTPFLTASEAIGILELIEKYSQTWKWIEEFDNGTIKGRVTFQNRKKIDLNSAIIAINKLKNYLNNNGGATKYFAKEMNFGLLESALNNIYQTFNGKELYPSYEEKAANLLYLIIKNHPFVDGNKRIGALLFLMFLNENMIFDEILKKFSNNAMTALCYLISVSPPKHKRELVELIISFISFQE